MSDNFVTRLREALAAHSRTRFLTSEDAVLVSHGSADRYELENWLSEFELKHDLVVCVADAALTTWTHAVLRSADQVASRHGIGRHDQSSRILGNGDFFQGAAALGSGRNPSLRLCPAEWALVAATRRLHDLSPIAAGPGRFHSLWRFLTGQAIGLVAGGGGAFGPCHVGIFNAFREAGVAFDIGGSSVGSVMAAGFACLTETEDLKSALHEIFVQRRALSRLTLPRYGLLDHRILEDELQKRNPGDIEDLWMPYFAVAADLSTDTLRVMREGPLWQAISSFLFVACSFAAIYR